MNKLSVKEKIAVGVVVVIFLWLITSIPVVRDGLISPLFGSQPVVEVIE